MTLTELKYIVALAQERHFGRAAQKCFVTQPTLSLALAKLEDELGLKLFERNKNEVLVTGRGQAIIEQARRVLDEVGKIQHLARGNQDQLVGALRLGVIPTIGPYLLPELVPILRKRAPEMPLNIEENFTGNLAPMLRDGELDVAIIALPFALPSVKTRVVYEEPFSVVVPDGHRWGQRRAVKPGELADENLLVLNNGHCFRDQVLEVCPGQSNTALAEGRAGQLPRDDPQHGGFRARGERAPGQCPGTPLRLAAPEGGAVHRAGSVAQGRARLAHEFRPAPGR
jgi:LysR family hydrogen peroxide-inducible transcriptional activator